MPSDALSNWKSGLREALRALERRSQLRSLAEVHGVNLCSNDYLGLAQHPALRESLASALASAPRVGGTGSRLLSGHSAQWESLEDDFAKFAGTESSLFFSTGYAANVGLLSSLVGKDDVVFSDELNHASLIDGIRLSGARKSIYPHLDLDALERSLRQEQGAPWRKLIVTESVFSMDGDIAPLREISVLAEKYGAALVVDEAHATAVHGPRGAGIAAGAGLVPQLLAVIHTCGKGLGSAGAFVCGSALLKDYLVNHARTFIFSTAPPPYLAAQIHAALSLAQSMDAGRLQLLESSRRLARLLQREGFRTSTGASQIIPILIGKNDDALDAAEALQREGFAVRAIRPPTVPDGTSRLRLSLTSLVPERELDRLVHSLVSWRSRTSHPAGTRHS